MKKELVSIIVPVYNVEKYLDKCIETLIHQTYQNIEIILIDDGSTDSSRKKANDWKKQDSRIKMIHQNHQGVSSARNKGINLAKGKYIIFIDADDYTDKDLIEKLANKIETTNSDLSVCGFYYVNKEIKSSTLYNQTLKEMDQKTFLDNICKEYYKGYLWNKLLIKEKIGTLRFDENKKICEDLLFIVKYTLNCQKISYIPESLYYYVNHQNSTMDSIDNHKRLQQLLAIEEIIDIIKKETTSSIYHKLENDSILIGKSLLYQYQKEKTTQNQKTIETLKNLMTKYRKDKCIKYEKNLSKKIKLFLCIYTNNLYQYLKTWKGDKS